MGPYNHLFDEPEDFEDQERVKEVRMGLAIDKNEPLPARWYGGAVIEGPKPTDD